jgi:hypothetical protein
MLGLALLRLCVQRLLRWIWPGYFGADHLNTKPQSRRMI